MQIKFNTLKKQRNEVLAQLYVISSHIGKHDKYFVDDPTGNTSAKEKDKAKKIEQAKNGSSGSCARRGAEACTRASQKGKAKERKEGSSF